MTDSLKKFADEIKIIYGNNLRSFVLYGSAASGEFNKKYSDFNTLIVLENLNLNELKKISAPVNKWIKKNNPPPLIFTKDRIQNSSDVFPIEFLDMRDNHNILYGEDPFAGLDIKTENLRLELEHELKGKLIKLRESYILTEGKPKKVQELLVKSSSTFLALFRNVLRLLGEMPPQKKMDAQNRLCDKLELDKSIFRTIYALKEGSQKPAGVDFEVLINNYINFINKVIDFVDRFSEKAK